MAKKRVHGGRAPRPRSLAGVRPHKSLGQNFLIDEEDSGDEEAGQIVEIGEAGGSDG